MIRKTSRWLLITSISLLVVLAALTVSVRIFLPNINHYNVALSEYLSEQLGVEVSIGQIQAQWQQANPVLKVSSLQLQDQNNTRRKIDIALVSAELDLARSIRALSLVFKYFHVEGMATSAEQQSGRWMTVLSPKLNKAPSTTNGPSSINQLLAVVLQQSNVRFSNASLSLYPENKARRHLSAINFQLRNTVRQHHIVGEATLNYFNRSSNVSFAIEASDLAKDIRKTKLQLYAKLTNLSEQVFALGSLDISNQVKRLSLNTDVWAQWEDGIVSDLRGKVQLNDLQLADPAAVPVGLSEFDFALQKRSDGYQLQLRNLKLQSSEQKIAIKAIDAYYSLGEQNYFSALSFSEFDLTDLSQWLIGLLPMNESLVSVIKGLNPQGIVKNINVTWPQSKWNSFKVAADIEALSLNAYSGGPAVTGVSGLLRMSLAQGSIDLDSRAVSMHFPSLFDDAWQYDRAQGKVKWQLKNIATDAAELIVNSDLLSVSKGEMQARGRFSFSSPSDKKRESELTLLIGMRDNDIKDALHYMPKKVMSNGLREWINHSAQQGYLTQGLFMLRTAVREGKQEQSVPSVQVSLAVDKADINYDDAWPAVIGTQLTLKVIDAKVEAVAKGGEIAGNKLLAATVSTIDNNKTLIVEAAISGGVKSTFAVLQKTPIEPFIPKEIKSWKVSGVQDTDLKLSIDLEGEGAPIVNVRSKLRDTQIKDEALNLAFSSIEGSLSYDSLKGFNAKSLKGRFFGKATQVAIATKGEGEQQKTSIIFNGGATVTDLFTWLKIDKLAQLTGSAPYSARIDICPADDSCNQLLVNSQLKGLSVNLPAPWGKSAKQAVKLQVVANFDSQGILWRYNYADLVRGISRQLNPKTTSTSIVFGGARPKYTGIPGIRLSGQLANLDLSKLLSDFSSSSKQKVENQDSVLQQISAINFELNNVSLLSHIFKQAKVRVEQLPTHWNINLNSELATGSIKLPKSKRLPIEANLSKLVIKSSDSTAKKSTGSQNYLASKLWPSVSLAIEQLSLNGMHLGGWRAQMAANNAGYGLNNIVGNIAGTAVTGEISWVDGKRPVTSHLALTAKGKDFGAVLKQLGFAKVLESQKGTLSTQLSWSGYPWQLTQRGLNGKLAFELSKGRIIEAGTSANFLRIFGLLNLNTVVKRLKLDFSDLTDKGVSYDKVSAKYTLKNGVASNDQPLTLEGPSTSVKMSGTIDLAAKTLEQTMDVAIPLTSNAPVAALLLATPQTAAVAFIIDKLIGKRLAKLTSLRYRVSGSWLSPKINAVTPGALTK